MLCYSAFVRITSTNYKMAAEKFGEELRLRVAAYENITEQRA